MGLHQLMEDGEVVTSTGPVVVEQPRREVSPPSRHALDKTGRAIAVGDVLKVYHFTAALRRKKHYMYKQVVANDNFRDGTPYLKVSHLDLTDDTYVIFCDDERLPGYEIVDSIKCDHHDRPRHTEATP